MMMKKILAKVMVVVIQIRVGTDDYEETFCLDVTDDNDYYSEGNSHKTASNIETQKKTIPHL